MNKDAFYLCGNKGRASEKNECTTPCAGGNLVQAEVVTLEAGNYEYVGKIPKIRCLGNKVTANKLKMELF